MEKGFTLIELLIVIAVIAILAVGAFVALDPAQRFQDSRDATRWTDASALLDANKVHQVDNDGAYTTEVNGLTASTNYMIGTATGAACTLGTNPCDVTITAGNCVNLAGSDLINNGYLAAVPVGPNGSGSWSASLTGYYINRAATGILTVGACESENTATITVSR